MRFRHVLILLVVATQLVACEPKATDGAKSAPTALVKVEIAARRPMIQTLEAYGTADYAAQSQRIVDSAAEVVIEQVLVAPGQTVSPGQALLKVRSSSNSTLELERARNDRDAAEQEMRRTQRMFSQRLATNSDMTLAKQNADNARANFESASSRVGDAGTRTITADRELTVASVDVSRGDIVPADTPLLHLVSNAEISVRLGIEPADLRLVSKGQPVTISPVYDLATGISGTISEVARQVDAQTRLTQVLVALPATDQLLPGSTVRGLVELRRRDAVLSVPRDAILREDNTVYLFVVNGATARRIDVTVGQDDGNRIEVLSGLKGGEGVVVEGNYVLEDGMGIRLETGAPPQ
ncbi:MAG: efflux RND transporter periplasmic adaptor subunit [Lysobacterales bacterium]